MDIYTFLDNHAISYERCDHPAVFTCEESKGVRMDLPGADTKNLFLRDKKAKRHMLVVVGHEKKVDLKELSKLLDAKGLSFASPDRLKQYLDVEPGSVTLLGLINDKDHAVEVYIDQELWEADALRCHPLVNTATLAISHDGIERFLEATGHEGRAIVVPS